jgi:hypothetical protein
MFVSKEKKSPYTDTPATYISASSTGFSSSKLAN